MDHFDAKRNPREGTLWSVRYTIAVYGCQERGRIAEYGDTLMVLQPKQAPDWFEGELTPQGWIWRDETIKQAAVFVLYDGSVGWTFLEYFGRHLLPIMLIDRTEQV